MKNGGRFVVICVSGALCLAGVSGIAAGCGSSGGESTFGGGGGSSGNDASRSDDGSSGGPILGGGDGGASSGGPCVGLACRVHACTGGGSTTLSGVVYDPAGKVPLYNIAVFVPNSTPKPFTAGASCEPCSSLYTGDPVASALTDANGAFTMKNVPDGPNIPLVIQIGKWRKQLTISNVTQCQDNPQPKGFLKLPSKHDEPGADIPRIAISTGGSDTLECLLRRVGLDSAEYGAAGAGGAGRIEIFAGGDGTAGQHAIPNTSPPAPDSFKSLWDTKDDLKKYDIVLLSCEGHETSRPNQQALFDYAAEGGRIFASHYHYAWFFSGPFNSPNDLLATWTAGSNNYGGTIAGSIVTTLPDGGAFPKGQALRDWLGNNGALQGGKLPIVEARHNAVVTRANVPSQTWIVKDDETPAQTQYFSFNTPIPAPDDQKCGRVVFSDLHVGAASGDNPDQPVPTGCAQKDLSPQEKALEFMLFDLSSCLTPNGQPPQPPPPVVR